MKLSQFANRFCPDKLRPLARRIYSLRQDTSLPSSVSIEISTKCNRRCSYCPTNTAVNAKMDLAVFNAIIYNLQDANYTGIIDFIQFNEPLLCDGLLTYVAMANRVKKASIHITTNGDLLTEDLLDKLIIWGVDQLNVTQHLNVTQEWIDNIKRLKKLFPYHIHHTQVGEAGWNNRAGLARIPYTVKPDKTCRFMRSMMVDIKGNVLLCCNDFHGERIFGNLATEPLAEIYKRQEKIRLQVERGIFTEELCQGCVRGKAI